MSVDWPRGAGRITALGFGAPRVNIQLHVSIIGPEAVGGAGRISIRNSYIWQEWKKWREQEDENDKRKNK